MSVIAGSATSNTTPVDGTGTAAVFWGGGDMVLDPVSGNLLVSDVGRLRQVTMSGQVTTLDQTFAWTGLAMDASENLYGSPQTNKEPNYPFLVKRTPAGVIQTLIPPAAASSPDISLSSIAVDASGNIYGADTQNRQIIRITQAGAISVIAGSGANGSADGTGTAASFSDPSGIAFDPAGNLWVADNGNGVRKISPDGVVTTVMPGLSLSAITVDHAGNVYASSGFNLVRIDTTGKQVTYNFIAGAAGSNFLGALATDSNGALYVETRGAGAQIVKMTFN
ncbi:alkaline phosphatase PhoX [Paraburkholderia sp. J41]|uniref:alkaline phosphatase PhoX n=1 Tax=Paraburkholderia sp. J41 TaxID=2805433 RepID=UPI002AC35F23|nr:alkaline phosphatase PhoX [Paraburkholderia sp. J41]